MNSKWVKTLLLGWFVTVSVPLVYFHLWHNTSLPQEKPINMIELESYSSEGLAVDSKKWQKIHFITDKCLCSNDLAEYLVERGASKELNVMEKVIVVGKKSDFESRLNKKGFITQRISEEDLAAKYGITGVPLLVVISPEKKIEYYGGYDSRKINPGTDFKDTEILEQAMAGKSLGSLPKFGCAVSKELQATLDPFKLKYGDWHNE
ncbi:MAG: hypothetical protein AB8E15_10055 [Bdellovibrionales bacterium]